MKLEKIQMKSFLNKAASNVAGVVLFFVGLVLAGLGLTVVALLAFFAMAAAGLAILATPFIPLADLTADDGDRRQDTATVS